MKVIAGKDKDSSGEVLSVNAEKNRAVVSGINIARKHNKPTAEKPGGINDIPLEHYRVLKLHETIKKGDNRWKSQDPGQVN